MARVLAPPPTQGPSWLASVLYSPPMWLRSVLAVVGVLVAGGVAYRLYSDGSPSAQAQEQMGTILVTAIAVATATVAFSEVDLGAYSVEVALGALAGFVVTVVGKVLGRRLLRRWIAPERRTACAWISLTALLWVPLAIVPASPRTALLWSIIQWGLGVSAGMALLLAHETF